MFSADLLRHSTQGLGKAFLEFYNYVGLTYLLLKDIREYSQKGLLSASVEGFAKCSVLFKVQ